MPSFLPSCRLRRRRLLLVFYLASAEEAHQRSTPRRAAVYWQARPGRSLATPRSATSAVSCRFVPCRIFPEIPLDWFWFAARAEYACVTAEINRGAEAALRHGSSPLSNGAFTLHLVVWVTRHDVAAGEFVLRTFQLAACRREDDDFFVMNVELSCVEHGTLPKSVLMTCPSHRICTFCTSCPLCF